MKKIFYSMVAWLLCVGNAVADEMIINNVSVVQDETVDLPVNFSFTSTTDKIGFTFTLELPSGLTLETDEDDELVYEKGSSISKLNIVAVGNSIGGQPSSEKATIKGTEGALITLHLCADKSIKAGSYVVNVTQCTFTQKEDGVVSDIVLPDFTFTVTVSGTGTTEVVLDEASTTPPVATDNVTVNVTRAFTANQWSTICLPFAMTDAQMKDAFGDSYQLADFSGCTAEKDGDATTSIKVSFTSVTSGLAANHPYIIKTSKDVSTFTVASVNINPSGELELAKSGGTMKGNYANGTIISKDGLFLYGGQFWYSAGSTKMKAFRACFYLDDVLTEKARAATRTVISIDGDGTTGIDALKLLPAVSGKVYSLSGQDMGNNWESLKNGVYIVNGKKVVKK